MGRNLRQTESERGRELFENIEMTYGIEYGKGYDDWIRVLFIFYSTLVTY